MIIDRVVVDMAQAGTRSAESALPYPGAVIGIKREDLVGHGRDQHQVAGPVDRQCHSRRYQRRRFSTPR
jgi:hypothetical protein